MDDLGGPRPHLPAHVTGPGRREQKAGALWGGQSHEEGIESGVREVEGGTVSEHGSKTICSNM